MAPFHPLPYEARALAARALAALAVFCTIAVVLLAGSAGPIASAEAKKDKDDWQGGDNRSAQQRHSRASGQRQRNGNGIDNWNGNGNGNRNGNGNGNAWGKGGGGGKWDPPEPEEP